MHWRCDVNNPALGPYHPGGSCADGQRELPSHRRRYDGAVQGRTPSLSLVAVSERRCGCVEYYTAALCRQWLDVVPTHHRSAIHSGAVSSQPRGRSAAVGIVLTDFVGVNHSYAMRVCRTSADAGTTWTAERTLTDGSSSYTTGAHDRLRLLSNGRLIQSVHFKVPPRTVDGPIELRTLVFASDDGAKTWHPRGLPDGSDRAAVGQHLTARQC